METMQPSGIDTDIIRSIVRSYVQYRADRNNSIGRVIEPRTLLHLHRFTAEDLQRREIVEQECERLLIHLARRFHLPRGSCIFARDNDRNYDLGKTQLRLVDEKSALQIHAHCHYLLSPRAGELHLGLFAFDDRLLALATLSKFDLTHLRPLLPQQLTPDRLLVLSRFVSFDWSPRNTASYTLARVNRWLAIHRPGVNAIFSYYDPNVGFDGSIYRSINAPVIGQEHKKRYLYIDGFYISDRAMISRYGSAHFDTLRTKLGTRVERSKLKLRPLQTCLWATDGRKLEATDSKQSVDPPSSLVS